MTQNEIIEMAKKAGIIHPIHVLAHLEDFAKLVEEKVRQELREEIIYTWVPPHFVDLAVKEEREACLNIAESMSLSDANMSKSWRTGCRDVAEAIRSRVES